MRWILRGLALLGSLCLAGEAPAQSELYEFKGDEKDDRFGQAVANAGDVNGDGVDDLVVGAHQLPPILPKGYELILNPLTTATGPGYARVLSGPDGAILHHFAGSGVGDQFGRSVDGVGDLDGDGRPEVLVGAPQSFSFSPIGFLHNAPGYARVHSGATGAQIRHFDGLSPKEGFGHAVSAAGDVDADGVPDLIIGAPNYTESALLFEVINNLAGRAFVISGADGHVIHTFVGDGGQWFLEFGAGLGYSVADVGDLNQDGYDDVLAGTDSWKSSQAIFTSLGNYASVFSGQNGTELYRIQGESEFDGFGADVDAAGDLDADGALDLLIGAPFDDNLGPSTGSARIHSGTDGAVLHLFNGDPAGVRFGASVSRLGDIDQDGFDDVVIASRTNPSHPGLAELYGGEDGVLLAAYPYDDPKHVADLMVSGVGDLNGDGLPELAIGIADGGAGKTRVYPPADALGEPIAGYSFSAGDELVGQLAQKKNKKKVDTDLARFTAVKDMKFHLDLILPAAEFKPIVSVHRLKKGKAGKKLKSWKLKQTMLHQTLTFNAPNDGEFVVVITGGNNGYGDYRAHTHNELPSTALAKTVLKSGKHYKVDTAFRALAGSRLDADVTLLSGYPTAPKVQVITPGKSVVPPELYQSETEGGIIRLRNVPLMESGKYRLRVKGGEKKAEVEINLAPTPPASALIIAID